MPTPFPETLRSLVGDGPHQSLAGWIVGGALAAIWLTWFLFGSVTVYELSSRARLEAREAPHHVAGRYAGTIVATELTIGRDVRAGDILVELDATGERLRLAEEAARAQALARRIASLELEIAARREAKGQDQDAARAAADAERSRLQVSDISLQVAREGEKRIARLTATGSATAVEANRTAAEAQKLAAGRDALLAEMRRADFAARTRASEQDAQIARLLQSIAGFEGDLAMSRATAERLAAEIEGHVVRAPVSGRLGDVTPLSRGAYVAEGQRLATVVPQGGLIAVAEFDASAILGRVRPGQAAALRLDGFPWTRFGTVPATVVRVASELRDGHIRVEFALDAAAGSSMPLQHGLPGAVEVNIETVAPSALVKRAVGLVLAGGRRDDQPAAATP